MGSLKKHKSEFESKFEKEKDEIKAKYEDFIILMTY